MNDKAVRLKGVIPALAVSQTDAGGIDHALVDRQLAYLAAAGIHGLFVNGTTGEGAILTTAEKLEILELAQKGTNAGVAVCAVSIQPSTDMALAELQQFQTLEPDFVAVTTPYYYGVSQAAIVTHFESIADASPVPLILYNIPQNTHNAMQLDTIARLAKHPNIVGIKDSSGDFETFNQAVYTIGDEGFACIQGDDMLAAASLAAGAAGVVTGLGNVRVEPYLELYCAACAGDRAGMQSAQLAIYETARIIAAANGNIIPAIKAAMEHLGRGSRAGRLAGMDLSAEEFERVGAVVGGFA